MPDWERLLAAERHLEHLVPGAVLVGNPPRRQDGTLETSRALWNRTAFDLRSDVLAQMLERGEIDAWRVLYGLARTDPQLRSRIKRIVLTAPLPLPRFWLAALVSLGEPADLGADVPTTTAI